MRGVKEITTVIVLKQTTALGPQTTVLARFNLVCFNATGEGGGDLLSIYFGLYYAVNKFVQLIILLCSGCFIMFMTLDGIH